MGEEKRLHSLVILLLAGVMMMIGSGTGEALPLEMNATQWSFVEGEWRQDAEGVITAPDNDGHENLAFFTPQAYQDFEAEFEFRWDMTRTTAAFLFRAQDPRHYYVVDFPAVGQQYRAENFWATVAKVDENGWRQGLHMQPVPGVTSAPRVWQQARVRVTGNEIRVWVNGRPLAVVHDDTYSGPGHIGLGTYSMHGPGAKSSFRNLQIRGVAVSAPPWDSSLQPRRPSSALGTSGGGASLGRDADGTLLTRAMAVGGPADDTIMASRDNGRSWAPTEEYSDLPMRIGPEGRWEKYAFAGTRPFAITRRISTDRGASWTREEVGEVVFPDHYRVETIHQSSLLELRDGALLLYGFALVPRESVVRGGRMHETPWPQGLNFCVRSADGGDSWSTPIDLDGPPYDDQQWLVVKEALEVSMAQTAGGKLMALIRPYFAHVMWESTSDDGGQSWTPLTHGHFPMYASINSMVGTSSGALVIGGRFPGLSLQVSHDGGMSWTYYQLDTAGWANGAMLEVEPDVILYVYGGKSAGRDMRYVLIRITPEGIEPVH